MLYCTCRMETSRIHMPSDMTPEPRAPGLFSLIPLAFFRFLAKMCSNSVAMLSDHLSRPFCSAVRLKDILDKKGKSPAHTDT